MMALPGVCRSLLTLNISTPLRLMVGVELDDSKVQKALQLDILTRRTSTEAGIGLTLAPLRIINKSIEDVVHLQVRTCS